MIHVRTGIKRPSPDIIAGYRELSSATVHEASGRKGAVDPAIKPISRRVKICGPAFTVQCAPGDNLMLHKALEKAQPGDVIVASVGGQPEYGYWGSLMAVSAMARGLGGLAIDGCVRDSEEIISMGFPVFSRGFAIRGTAKATLGTINYPTVFGGVMVNPGDIVIGDDDGIVVVALNEAEEVLEKSIRRKQMEEEKAKVLASGVSSVEYNKLDGVFRALGLVEE
ncbi:MAG: 4-carboxy-4-hydroxy-2-oxoadipate aldolase/oxaloacetate decarboxylase [Bacillota bacterium]|jgi:4-hydroxy-4-methyl-2-oxoglutarate aldolase|nr:4-carboxy-4-hydroxy-2-oxoadipate aldolase/oxaloacetate decarboxylase [Bacillota bacterium]HPU62349.1 4-carboxy-4-hydroxy-2-oxoadipate aldolase/oxaloacetate decarboxylase [Bacillota bacterium]